jgi:hypothetical protein
MILNMVSDAEINAEVGAMAAIIRPYPPMHLAQLLPGSDA